MFAQFTAAAGPRLWQSAAFGLRYALQGTLLYGAMTALLWLLGFGPATVSVPMILGGA